MLDDDTGGRRELPHAFDGGVRVGDVVERHLLALQQPRVGDRGRALRRVAVEGRLLMGVLAVAEVLHLLEHERQHGGEGLAG